MDADVIEKIDYALDILKVDDWRQEPEPLGMRFSESRGLRVQALWAVGVWFLGCGDAKKGV